MGMKIIGFDPFLSEERAKEMVVRLSSLDEIYKESDFITLHVPLTDDTRGLISGANSCKRCLHENYGQFTGYFRPLARLLIN